MMLADLSVLDMSVRSTTLHHRTDMIDMFEGVLDILRFQPTSLDATYELHLFQEREGKQKASSYLRPSASELKGQGLLRFFPSESAASRYHPMMTMWKR